MSCGRACLRFIIFAVSLSVPLTMPRGGAAEERGSRGEVQSASHRRDPVRRYEEELEALERRASAPAEGEIGQAFRRAHEVLRQIRAERAAGRLERARALLALIPLHLEVIRELLEVTALEAEASEAEARVEELERERSERLGDLERLLERLAEHRRRCEAAR